MASKSLLNNKVYNSVEINNLKNNTTPEPLEIIFSNDSNEGEIVRTKTELLKDVVYMHTKHSIDTNQKYLHSYDRKQSLISSLNLTHTFYTIVISALDDPNTFCAYHTNSLRPAYSPSQTNRKTAYERTYKLYHSQGLFENYTQIRVISKEGSSEITYILS